MEFFVYHRDRIDSGPLRTAMVEEHWTYMDGFADELVVRGPVFDGERLVGSVHIVNLSTPAAAWRFAFEEPCYQAGAYRDVMVRRWHNLLGRDMWAFPGRDRDADRYLVLALGPDGDVRRPEDAPADRQGLVAYGPLVSDDGETWLGTATIVEARDKDQARAVLEDHRYSSVEVHEWTFGGRR